MPTLFQKLRGRKPTTDVARYDISWYLEQLNNPLAIHYGTATSSRNGLNVEEVQNSFVGYVDQAYKSNGPIFAIVLARLMLFSEARFQFRRLINGRPGDLFGTQALERLERPWPNGTTGELLARMEQDASVAGNAYIVNEGDRLRRLRPDWVQIVLTAAPEEAVASDVQGYAYHPGGFGHSAPEFFLPEDMCHWSPIPDPAAQYRGMSWITPVLRELMSDQAATLHKQKFFENGATLGPVISVKEGITADQFKKFVAESNAAHQGVNNAYKPMYVGGGADVTLQGADMRQMDFSRTQGAGETRLCAAGGVPPIIVGLSEGLASATYSNYGMARRKFGDHWARPQWRSACAALSNIIDVPRGAELWYDDRDIAFLREDQKDLAEIQSIQAGTVSSYITSGFTPESAVSAVTNDDMTLLIHSGMLSVQLQPPGDGVPVEDPALAGETPVDGEIEAARHLPGGHNQQSHGRRGVSKNGARPDLLDVPDERLQMLGHEVWTEAQPATSVDQIVDIMRRRKAANPDVSTADLIRSADVAAEGYHPKLKGFFAGHLKGREAEIDKPPTARVAKAPEPRRPTPKKAPAPQDFPRLTARQAQQMQDDMPPPWTGEQRNALRYYTGNSAVPNGILRGWIAPPGKSDTERRKIEAAQKQIAAAKAAMRPSIQPMLVRRTAGPEQFGVATTKELESLVGNTFVERGFLSTTTAASVGVGGKVKIELELPTGTPMAFVKSVSKYPHEDEVLLPPGMKYTIVSVSGRTVRVRVEAT